VRYEDILYDVADGIATITFNRPDVLNALRHETWSELQDAVGQAEADDAIRVIVLTGAGEQAFVAGADISVMAQETGYISQLSFVPRVHRVTCAIEDCRKPVIARVNGYALGGGTEIALACDIRVASGGRGQGQGVDLDRRSHLGPGGLPDRAGEPRGARRRAGRQGGEALSEARQQGRDRVADGQARHQ
jgi:1,4-dihydroxy-2-naphthoyl-CoA synthase